MGSTCMLHGKCNVLHMHNMKSGSLSALHAQSEKLQPFACSQLLGEFAELCGPFAAVLKSIRDELVRCGHGCRKIHHTAPHMSWPRCSMHMFLVPISGSQRVPHRMYTSNFTVLQPFPDYPLPYYLLLPQLKSVYSWYYVSERGLLVFDQLPWFAVAERLEREKEVMVQEREQFRAMLREQQVGNWARFIKAYAQERQGISWCKGASTPGEC